MRRATLVAALLLVLAPSAPAKAPPGPAAVVRAWTAALNRSDNEAAANLFAKNAVVIQNGLRLVLSTHHLAVLWMEGVPCSGSLIHVRVTQDLADAIFVLGSRKGIMCDAPGVKARAAFVVRKGKIIRWLQLPVPKSATGSKA
jgi:limonene-1,2-epoxide hydrolase